MDGLTFLSVIVLAFLTWRLFRRANRSEARWQELVGRLTALEDRVRRLLAPAADLEAQVPAEAPQTGVEPRVHPPGVAPIESTAILGLASAPVRIPSSPPRSAGMFCTDCGNPIDGGQSVCTKCGRPVHYSTATAAAARWQTTAHPAEGPSQIHPAPSVLAGAGRGDAPPKPAMATPGRTAPSSTPNIIPLSGTPLGGRVTTLLNLEEMLGSNLFTKLGVLLVVIGVTFWVAAEWHQFGPGLKIAIGYGVSSLMLIPGIIFERRERWRTLARAGIGGGWALLFFITYAMHHIAASRLIKSERVDLVLMLVVAAAMVAHTLKYRSQVVTGLAFLLGFTTVTVSHVTTYSLVASAILALGLVVIVQRMRWYELEVFGILATFLNHWYWLRPIIQRVGQHHFFPEYRASETLLISYWLLFSASYVVRRVHEDQEENVSTFAALLNIGFFLGIMGYQAVHPPHPFRFFMVVGAVEFSLGQLPITRGRRAAFAVLTTAGAVLLATAFPYKYSGSNLSAIWLADAEAFFLAGVFLREIIFRWIGLAVAFLVSAQMLWVDGWRTLAARSETGLARPEFALAWLFALAVVIFYANAHWLPRRWKDLVTTEFEQSSLKFISYVAALLAVVGAWLAWPGNSTAVAWGALALIFAMAARRWKLREISFQSHTVAVLVFLRTVAVNLPTLPAHQHHMPRLASVSVVAALLYAASRWAGEYERDAEFAVASVYMWAGTILLALLAWYELEPVAVAVAWTLLGLVLFELGMGQRSASLRLQAYGALAASFVRLLFVNLTAAGTPGQISPRVYTILPLILSFYYVYWRLRDASEDTFSLNRRLQWAAWQCFFGTTALVALARFELDPAWVAAGWAAIVLILLAMALASERGIFLTQGLLLGAAVLYRALTFNLFETSYFIAPVLDMRRVTVGATAALLFASLAFAYKLRAAERIQKGIQGQTSFLILLYRRPEQFFFFGAIALVTLLAAVDLHGGRMTLGWGLEAVMIFLFALGVGERSFRLTGVGLLLLCVGKIIFVDVWTLRGSECAITLSGLGMALILVSWLYAKYRAAIRRYL